MPEEKSLEDLAWQINHDAALRAHAVDTDWQRIMLESALKFADGSIKAITLTTGGAVVVGLAFIGSIYGAEPALAKALVRPVFMLAAGAISGALCAAFAYVAQYFYAQASMAKTHTWDHPYIQPKASSARWAQAGATAHIVSVAFAVAAFGSVIWGGIVGWSVLGT